jgi:hypothetical protein
LGKLLGNTGKCWEKVGLTWEDCREKWDYTGKCWKKWDYTGTGKCWEKSGIDLGKLLGKVGLYGKMLGKVGLTSGKLLEKVGLTWENCWE